MSLSASWSALPEDACPVEDNHPNGPLVVEPEVSRLAVAIVVLIFGLIFTSVPAAIVIGILQSGFSPGIICPGLFLLFSLAIDAFAVYLILKCFNPKPTLALSQRNLYPGDEFEVSWMFKGKASAIRNLKVTLLGKEVVKYQQGTNTRTEESVFLEKVLIETEDPNQIAKGYSLVELPRDTMHSFKSKNNEILWVVQLHGVVNWWPDLDDAFPIRILTPPVSEPNHA
ncbi:MAG: hypothetical protein ACK553_04275 [Planctomycetota bacterium]|jgi:hypothetical protein